MPSSLRDQAVTSSGCAAEVFKARFNCTLAKAKGQRDGRGGSGANVLLICSGGFDRANIFFPQIFLRKLIDMTEFVSLIHLVTAGCLKRLCLDVNVNVLASAVKAYIVLGLLFFFFSKKILVKHLTE